METGGVLSHGAIVAREFGLPAVAGLLSWLMLGQRPDIGIAVALFGMACEGAFSKERLAAVAPGGTERIGDFAVVTVAITIDGVTQSFNGSSVSILGGSCLGCHPGGARR